MKNKKIFPHNCRCVLIPVPIINMTIVTWRPGVFAPIDLIKKDDMIPLAGYVLNYTDRLINNWKKGK